MSYEWKIGPGMYIKIAGENLLLKETMKAESLVPLKMITGAVIESTSKAFGKIGRLKIMAGGTVAAQYEAAHDKLKPVLEFLNSKDEIEKALSMKNETLASDQKKKKPLGLIIAGGVALLLVLPLICGKSGKTNIPANGEIGYLHVNTGDLVIAANEASLDELTKASVNKDSATFGLMIIQGKLIDVKNNTKIKMIEAGITKSKVQVIEGAKSGRMGWIANEFIKK